MIAALQNHSIVRTQHCMLTALEMQQGMLTALCECSNAGQLRSRSGYSILQQACNLTDSEYIMQHRITHTILHTLPQHAPLRGTLR